VPKEKPIHKMVEEVFDKDVTQDLIDELIIYMAPTTIGEGQAIVDSTLQSVSNRTFNISSVGLVANDLRYKVSFR